MKCKKCIHNCLQVGVFKFLGTYVWVPIYYSTVATKRPNRFWSTTPRWVPYWTMSVFSTQLCRLYGMISDKSGQEVGGEREHAAALYLACRHLPTPLLASPGERVGMLLDAAKLLEKIGDRKRLQQCYHLMQSLGTHATVTN